MGKKAPWRSIASETCLAHAAAVVNDKGADILVTQKG